MKSASTLTLAALAALASATPLRLRERGELCNTPPAAPAADTQVQPLEQPSCDTAALCLQACEANSQCQSFVFGLAPSASTPECLIFGVPAAQVPSQETNFNVFDKACTSIPNTPPTESAPIGVYVATILAATIDLEQDNDQGTTGQNPPTNDQGTTWEDTESDTQGTTGQNAKLKPSPVSTPVPTPASASKEWSEATPKVRSSMDRQATCGSAPSGPSTNPPAPFTTKEGVTKAADCLALCNTTSGCKSCELGKTSPTGPVGCLLFPVPASQLPPPTDGQSLVAYDVGC